MLGFDDLERLMEGLARQTVGAGYPPYNITHIADSGDHGNDILRITLAVAGFGADDMEVRVEGSTLTVSGRQTSGRQTAGCETSGCETTYLHHGIAGRPFQRVFNLRDGLTVIDAQLENGLLNIDLTQPLASGEPRKITVTKRG
jgi:HSP20 family molecular chaperone IbpA